MSHFPPNLLPTKYRFSNYRKTSNNFKSSVLNVPHSANPSAVAGKWFENILGCAPPQESVAFNQDGEVDTRVQYYQIGADCYS